MKKLMIAAAIVCAAAMSQAAQIDWTVAKKSFTMADGSTAIGGVNVSLVQFASETALQTAWTDLAAGTKTIADYQVIDTQPGSTESKSLGAISVTGVKSANLTAGTEQFYALFIQDGSKFLLSNYSLGIAYDPNAEDDWKKEGTAAKFSTAQFDMTNTQQLGSWSTVAAVPEPTSGLLLLLGVAGLALRRRRA